MSEKRYFIYASQNPDQTRAVVTVRPPLEKYPKHIVREALRGKLGPDSTEFGLFNAISAPGETRFVMDTEQAYPGDLLARAVQISGLALEVLGMSVVDVNSAEPITSPKGYVS